MSHKSLQVMMPPPVTVCTDFPPRVNSVGLWNTSETWLINFTTPIGSFSWALQNYTIPTLEFEMTLMFAITQLSHLVLKMFGLPVFAAQLLTGLLLGDAGLDRVIKSVGIYHMNPIFPFSNQEILNTISLFGYTLFTFLIGVKMDLGIISKTGKSALYTGIISLVVPLFAGFGAIVYLYIRWSLNGAEIVQLLYVTSIHSLSPSPVIACLLSELKILNSELGRLGLASSLVSDLSSVVLTSVTTLLKVMQIDLKRGLMDMVAMLVYTLFVVYVCRPVMLWMVKQTPEGKPVKDSYIFCMLFAVLASALLSHWCELSIVAGPLILGLAVPDGPPLGATLVNKLDFMVNRVFMPVFVTTSMMRVTVFLEVPPAEQRAVLAASVIVAVVFFFKFVASMVPPLCFKMPIRDAVALGLIMSSKGVVEMASYSIARDTWVITTGVFNLTMFTVLFSAFTVPPLLKLLYDPKRKYSGYQKRNLMHCKPDSELRILACINRADNTPAIINLLDASCPTRDSPIALHVVHLLELVGRTTPVLISHNLDKRTLSNFSYSENIILSFSHFQRDNEGAVFVQVFTAISPPQYMYDDVCSLALDKVTSLIILPFHRKWSSVDGALESENQNIRTLNCSVLQAAPCSVGILVNRGHIKSTNSLVSPKETYRVAIIFIGGNDDREALAFAKRMVKDACISLTVIRFVDASEEGESSYDKWDWVQDNEVLKELKYGGIGYYVSYVEENVEDGTQTTRKIRSLMDEDEYDLFIVGRRFKMRSNQTMGLEQWNEFPELGVIGDMLSSTDTRCKSSVLIIQQQQQRQG